MSLSDFISQMAKNPILILITLLTLGVILVNGWTDAPNAVATCVSTRSMPPKTAIIMAAIMNFLGIFVMTMINSSVAETVSKMVDFGDDSKKALIGLCAALVGIVIWASAAWKFGIPTSESHALIAGLSGAAIAMNRSFSGISGAEWIKVIYGLALSTILGFFGGYFCARLIKWLFARADRRKTEKGFQYAQIGGAAAMAFMHGAQDGQKFMAVFLLGMTLAGGSTASGGSETFLIPIWLMFLCSGVMALGTSIGGYRIIKSVGMDMVKLSKYQGFAADFSATAALLLASLTGMPVSTTHTKTTAIMGVGAEKRITSVNWGIVKDMFAAWFLTFPGCGLVGYLMTILFLAIFK